MSWQSIQPRLGGRAKQIDCNLQVAVPTAEWVGVPDRWNPAGTGPPFRCRVIVSTAAMAPPSRWRSVAAQFHSYADVISPVTDAADACEISWKSRELVKIDDVIMTTDKENETASLNRA